MIILISNFNGMKSWTLFNNKMVRCILALSFVMLSGCGSLSQSRIVYILDSEGNPIKGASVTPYPIIIGNNSGNFSNESGRVKIYNVSDDGRYIISANGYARKEIAFPENNGKIIELNVGGN